MNYALVLLHHTHVEAALSGHYTSSTWLWKGLVYFDVAELRNGVTVAEKYVLCSKSLNILSKTTVFC
jgi:hypothetical protein